ncbi:cytochrome P450 [Streptomyces fuscichromogenes]|uniref:Cytochrome P450 n=1 Tax=Streptomyces fuscichromogenes TaxID=1324013 RepID=A0A917XG73_9ACTN|nr:cytochrome P450 [Streptomyces fuscichromogenes]GGN23030.1 cytochrome P450 [Streptomyces fuscichromogenes]
MASTLLKRILHPDSRPHPWDLYADLREEVVSVQDDGTHVVSGYDEITALLRDPRVSVDRSKADADSRGGAQTQPAGQSPVFLVRDNPGHDRLRGQAMRHFGPPELADGVEALRPMVEDLVRRHVDRLTGHTEFDLVAEVAYPVPVLVVCHLLGIPFQDALALGGHAEEAVRGAEFQVDPHDPEVTAARTHAQEELSAYFAAHIERLRANPGDDMVSRMIHDDGPGGRMTMPELLGTVNMLFVGGHETTVNLIANSLLLLLRHPDQLARLRADPALAAGAVEETLRLEPSVHMRPRIAVDDIRVGDQVIPRGSSIILNLAAANRDPRRFTDPDTFDITRTDNAHLSFAGGIHYCFGAALGRLEGQIAVRELTRRLVNPRLLQDPPPYRVPADLRGPSALRLAVDGVRAA